MPNADIDIVNVVGTHVDANGFLSLQPEAEGPNGAAPPYPTMHWHGLWSCPRDPVVDPGSGRPDPSKSCSMLRWLEGSSGFSFPLHDVRTIADLPIGTPGETIVHNDFGAFSRYHEDGSITHSTTSAGGASTGQTIADRITPTGFLRFAPWGKQTFDATGFRVKHVGGARFALGYAGGLIPGLESYARIQADIVEINASAIAFGPAGVPTQPVAQAVPLVAILGTISDALVAIQVAMGTITAGSGGGPAAAAAAPQVEAAVAAIAGALVVISTQTAIG